MRGDEDLAALGRAVRRFREAGGLSQEELAERSGLHRNYIGGIERGERNVGVKALFRLAEGLGLRPAELLADGRPLPTSAEPRAAYAVAEAPGGGFLADAGALRTAAERRARRAPLDDGVFAVLHFNLHHRLLDPPPRQPPIDPRKLFADRTPAELDAAIGRAQALRNAALDAGLAVLAAGGDEAAVIRRLGEAHPGFRPETYREVMDYGRFLAA